MLDPEEAAEVQEPHHPEAAPDLTIPTQAAEPQVTTDTPVIAALPTMAAITPTAEHTAMPLTLEPLVLQLLEVTHALDPS